MEKRIRKEKIDKKIHTSFYISLNNKQRVDELAIKFGCSASIVINTLIAKMLTQIDNSNE